jgi:hypothetical protein
MREALFILLLSAGCSDRAPGPALIRLTPAKPTTDDELVVHIDRDALDPEGGDVGYSYRWYRDDELQSDYGEATLPAEATSKGELWRVEVLADDGGADGPPVQAEVTVLNSPPVVTITMSPDEVLANDDIVASASVSDADGDLVDLDWTWTRDGESTSYSGDTIPASATMRWQTWEVFISSNDGEEQGEIATAAAVVGNAPPSIDAVTLAPAEAYEDSILEVTIEATDLEQDVPTLEVAWYVDGAVVPDHSASTLSGEHFDKHQEVWAEVVAWDPYEASAPVSSDSVTILNSAPTLTTVTMKPDEIWESTTVSCVGSDLEDLDDDTLSMAYTWYVNETPVSSDATIDGSLFDQGDEVYCSVGADDGEVVGPTVSSDPRTVLNGPPSIDGVSLSPSSPAEGDTITATLGTITDPDGDAVSTSYAWYVDGTKVSSATELSSDSFDKHQEIYLEVTPSDGAREGDPAVSATITAINTAPAFTTLTTDPMEAAWGESITASPSGWIDVDNDAEGYQYAWYVDGVLEGSAESLDLGAFARGSQVWVEVTAHDGEDAGNSISTDPLVIQRVIDGDDARLVFTGALGDNAGFAVALAGDLTGDGASDIIVGAPGNSDRSSDAGAIYLVAGDATGELGSADATRMLWNTDIDEEAGWSVSSLGDVNADGWDDLIVGVPYDTTFASDSGAAFVILGPVSRDDEIGAAGTAILGTTANEYIGWSVGHAGDVDGDGYDDILLGAAGRSSDEGAAFIEYGPFSSVHYSTTLDVTMPGEAEGDEAGSAVAGAGDVDGDGNDDLLVGAPAESSADTEAGAAYLIYGPPGGVYHLGYADAKLTGEAAYDNAGYHLASAGDVDGDGDDDFLVGARWEDSGGTAAGAAYLITGAVSGTSSLGSAQAKLTGSAANELAGNAVSGTGDLNGDGYGDIVVGAEGRASLGTNTGGAYVLLGPLSGTIALDEDAYATIRGGAMGDKLGYSLAGGQDMDGDGIPDLVLGAPYEDGAGTSSGAALLFSGTDI